MSVRDTFRPGGHRALALFGMVPVLWTVLVVYGAMAFLGRDYDMPVAVLSASPSISSNATEPRCRPSSD